MDIRFKAGEPVAFIAARTFTMGANNFQFRHGQEIEFDGTTVTTDGESFPMPQLRGPVKIDWLTLAADYDEEAPVSVASANIQVRHPTQGGNPLSPPTKTAIVTVESDERQVGNTRTAAAATANRNKTYHRGAGKVRDQHGRVMDVEEQDGVHFRSLQTPAKSNPVLDGDNAGYLISNAKAPVLKPVKGRTEDEMLATMDEESKETYLAEKASRRAVHEADIMAAEAKSGRSVVNKVKKQAAVTREGMTISTTTGGGTEIADPTTGAVQTEIRVVEREGIRFTETNGPKRTGAEPRPSIPTNTSRMVAKSMCSDFPDNYDFGAPAKKRVARLQADFDDRPDVIRAAFAAENDEVKRLLVEEFPQAFSG